MPLARADSSNPWAVPRLCSMNAAPKPRPRMETSAPVRQSRLRSTSRESVFAKFEAARTLESSPPMPAPNNVRRINSRRDVPASIVQESLWTDLASMDGNQVQVGDFRFLFCCEDSPLSDKSAYVSLQSPLTSPRITP